MEDEFSRRVLVNVDVADYSSRTDVDQHELQHTLMTVLATAAAEAGFDRTDWETQPSGDGELAVLPAAEAEKRVIDELPAATARVLAEHNSGADVDARLRVRLAVHQGLVRPAAGGFAGTGVVTVSRILDSSAARSALRACPTADLVFLLSAPLYTELVLQRHTRLSPRDFREVDVRTKKFLGTAWLHVPGHDVDAVPLDTEEPSSERAEPPARASNGFHTTVNNPTVTGDWVIGIKNSFGS